MLVNRRRKARMWTKTAFVSAVLLGTAPVVGGGNAANADRAR